MDRRWRLILGFVLLLVFSAFFTKDLWPVDETRYAEVGREVVTLKSIFVLSKNGEPYSHKPPLYPWLMAIGYAIFGVHDWIPKLIPMLFSIGSLVLTGQLYRELYHDPAPDLLPVLVITSLYYFIFSFYAMFDLILTFWVLLAVLLYWRRRYTGCWVCLGLGILTKGPVVLVIAGLPIIVYRLLTQGWRGLKPRPAFWLGLILMLAVVGVWLVPVVLNAQAGFLQDLLVRQNVGRMAGAGGWAHGRPIYWYLLLFPVLAGPWAVFWYTHGWRRSLQQNAADGFIHTVIVTNIFAFSLISGKQMHYLIPVIPFLACWLARHAQEVFSTRASSLIFRAYAALAILGGLVFIWLGGGVQNFWRLPPSLLELLYKYPVLSDPRSFITLAWLPTGLLLVAGGIVGMSKCTRTNCGLNFTVGITVIFYTWLALVLVPAANTVMSPRDISEKIVASRKSGDEVAVFDPDTYDATYNFYSQANRLRVFHDWEAAVDYLNESSRHLLIVSEKQVQEDALEIVAAGWSFGEKVCLIRKP